jgi:hypothetical protein
MIASSSTTAERRAHPWTSPDTLTPLMGRCGQLAGVRQSAALHHRQAQSAGERGAHVVGIHHCACRNRQPSGGPPQALTEVIRSDLAKRGPIVQSLHWQSEIFRGRRARRSRDTARAAFRV